MTTESAVDATRTPILEVSDLSINTMNYQLVDKVSMALRQGERVGLIGESGSGKSLTALALMGLLPDKVTGSGTVRIADVCDNLLDLDEKSLSAIRGNKLAMTFQEPMTALNPTMKVGRQVAEAMTIHNTHPNRRSVWPRTLELLAEVHLPNPAEVANAYPHQLSGGQRQRVALALSLANDPSVLLCDEPTTALDVTVQALVLDLIVSGVTARNAALLLVTHDLAVVATVCERVLVMYGGRIVEEGPVKEVFTRPQHRYTQGLLATSDLEAVDENGHLQTIAGSVPAAGRFPSGCVFRNRCQYATSLCATEPAWSRHDATHWYACHHPANADDPTTAPVR